MLINFLLGGFLVAGLPALMLLDHQLLRRGQAAGLIEIQPRRRAAVLATLHHSDHAALAPLKWARRGVMVAMGAVLLLLLWRLSGGWMA